MPEEIVRMIEALDLEIKKVRGRGNSIELRGGEFKGKSDNNYLYSFLIDSDVYLRDDSLVKIVVDGKTINGSVVSLGEGILVIASEHDFGPNIPHARLTSDDSFLFERLKDKLKEINANNGGFNLEKAEQIIGIRPIRCSDAVADTRLLVDDLNAEQKTAISRALGSEITYIWGPPGTGKTTVLARIVEGYYYAGLSVLLLSNTNVAVDTALEMIAKRLKTDDGFHKGAVLRHGPIVKSELADEYGDRIEIDKVISRLGENLQKEKTNLESKKVNIEEQATSIRTAIADWEHLAQMNGKRKQLEQYLENMRSKKHKPQLVIESLAQELAILKSDLQRANKMGSIRRFFTGLNPEKINRNVATKEIALSAQKSALSETLKEIASAEAEIQKLQKQMRVLVDVVRQHKPYNQCKQSSNVLEKQIAEIVKSIQEIQTQLDMLRSEVIKNCKIVATTVYRTYLKGQIERSFDVVVIDEASMVALPLSFYCAGLATKHVVVAGDFRQLPPIIKSSGELAMEWLKKDIFYKSNIVDAVERQDYPDSLIVLQRQYRMQKEICNVINKLFYDGHLETEVHDIDSDRTSFPLGTSRLLYVNTASHHPWASVKVGTGSRYNFFHALLLRNIVFYLDKQGYLKERNVGVVSYYKEQTKLFKRIIEECKHIENHDAILPSTVHKFQGNEKDAILIDLTDSTGVEPSGFIRAAKVEEDGARLLNVALSRAKNHVVLIGNFDYLFRNVSPNAIVRNIVDIFIKEGEELNANNILALGPDDWIDGLRNLNPPVLEFDATKAGIFTEGTFYEAFRKDLMNAKESIIIFSPFVTQNGASRWMDILTCKISAGVHVSFATKPSDNQGGILKNGLNANIQNIRQTEVAVDLRTKMHEKFAIIDESILWIGSLNICSHKDTSEIMLRIPSAGACEQMMQFVTRRGRRQ